MTGIGCLLLALIAETMSPPPQTLDDLVQVIPKQVEGYRCEEERIYDRDTVFDYLNGGAEIYLTYDFQAVLARRYVHADGPEILFDLFDMGKSEDAFGIFSQEQESAEQEFGQGSEYTPGLLRLWKNRFFVSVTATQLTEDATQAIMSLGKSAADAIIGEGSKPTILELLPSEGLDPSTIRYLHSFMALRQHFSLGWKDVLNLDGRPDAVLALYSTPVGRSILLAVKYTDEDAAQKGEDDFMQYQATTEDAELVSVEREARRILSHDPPKRGSDQTDWEEGRAWSVVERCGVLLVIVLESPNRKEAGRLADGGLARWKEEPNE
jgi:hypothetical protein